MTADEITTRWREQTDRLALLFVGQCDPRIEAALADWRARVLESFREKFNETVPAKLAEIVDALVEEIRERRREIEAGNMSAQLQDAPV